MRVELVFHHLPAGYSVDLSAFDGIELVKGLIAEEIACYHHALSIDQVHSQQFYEFSLLADELLVIRVNNADNESPVVVRFVKIGYPLVYEIVSR